METEFAFAAAYLNTLSTQPVIFNDDYQQPPHLSLKRLPILPLPIPPPPAPKRLKSAQSSGSSSTAGINITFKSIKPPASYTLSVQPTDTINAIKAQLAHTHSSAPPPDAQRLLLKGKALADNKLLKEYNIKDRDTVNLVVKPGVEWNPNTTHNTQPQSQLQSPLPSPSSMSVSAPTNNSNNSLAVHADGPTGAGGPPKSRGRHQRIPSVVLSPSPSTSDLLSGAEGTPSSGGGAGGVEKDILLTLDAMELPGPVHPESLSTYHHTIANPLYWEKLLAFLKAQFSTESDTIRAFEDYLRASKGSLTASEIAKIRDHTGVVGMAGT
ncbi:hypothetical protein AX17_004631 [Amanita inopinata Kibby_2008]|nr:hypothetical protein AX17_004631 [Amanita inopinata Kibby_2008]